MKLITLAMAICLAGSAFGGEETILGSGEIDNGGFGALVMKFTAINGEFGLLVGGRGGWIINHTFSIGGAGYGLVNEVKARTVGPNGERYVDFGYGGAELEWVVNSDKVIHLSIHSLFGVGAIGYRNRFSEDESWRVDYGNYPDDQHYAFFVAEPGINVDVNVTTWFRTSVGGSYRFVSGVSSAVARNRDLAGPSAMLTLRFGSF